jgi:hypothetical protein
MLKERPAFLTDGAAVDDPQVVTCVRTRSCVMLRAAASRAVRGVRFLSTPAYREPGIVGLAVDKNPRQVFSSSAKTLRDYYQFCRPSLALAKPGRR